MTAKPKPTKKSTTRKPAPDNKKSAGELKDDQLKDVSGGLLPAV
ncbi:MAG TPA: hypothetical protein VFA12_17640 [Stellaceae bacterium]|nr:hypothetical protein [Stellaceae bacterium]